MTRLKSGIIVFLSFLFILALHTNSYSQKLEKQEVLEEISNLHPEIINIIDDHFDTMEQNSIKAIMVLAEEKRRVSNSISARKMNGLIQEWLEDELSETEYEELMNLINQSLDLSKPN